MGSTHRNRRVACKLQMRSVAMQGYEPARHRAIMKSDYLVESQLSFIGMVTAIGSAQEPTGTKLRKLESLLLGKGPQQMVRRVPKARCTAIPVLTKAVRSYYRWDKSIGSRMRCKCPDPYALRSSFRASSRGMLTISECRWTSMTVHLVLQAAPVYLDWSDDAVG